MPQDNWHNNNDFYFIRDKKKKEKTEPYKLPKFRQFAHDEIEETPKEDPEPEVRLFNGTFHEGEDSFHFNKKCKIRIQAEFLKYTTRTRVFFDTFVIFNGEEENLLQQVEAFIKKDKGYAEAEIMLYYGEKYYQALIDDPAAKCKYFFRAKHNTGEKIVESELLEMPCIRTLSIDFFEIPDITYNLNSAFPCLNKDHTFISSISSVYKYISENQKKEMVVFGHTDKSGSADNNMSLSEQRAKAIKAIIDNKLDNFVSAIQEYNTVSDIQQNLNTMNNSFGWATDCGKVDNIMGKKTEDGIKMFQAEYNLKFEKEIKVDGITGKQTWGALFEVFQDLIGEDFKKRCPDTEITTPTYGYKGEGVYACGPWFPASEVKTSYFTKEARRVEIAFYEKDAAPVLEVPQNPQVEIKPTECSVFTKDESTLNSVTIETLEEVSTDTCIAFFFDGTGQNRNTDMELGKDSNVSKIFELYDGKKEHGIEYRKAHYHIGVGTDPEKWYDDWIETIALGPVLKLIKDIFTDKTIGNFDGLITGKGGQERIKDALVQLSDFIKTHKNVPKIKVDVFGFSRGAALARHFTNLIYDIHQIKVRFLGIFDTVGSFGLGGNDINIGYALDVNADKVDRVVHYTARHEYRSLFDSTSIKRLATNHDKHKANPFNNFMETKQLPSNMIERDFAGAHADVGGGYKPHDEDKAIGKDNKRNEISRIPLYAMVDEAIKAGVPLKTIEEQKLHDSEIFVKAFSIPDVLKQLLNAKHDITEYNLLTNENDSDFKRIFENYIHDSRYFMDGNSETRSTFYHGIY